MSQILSSVIFFDLKRLPREERYSLPARKKYLDESVGKLRQRFPELVLGRQMPSSCSVGVSAREDVIGELMEYLEQHRMGKCQIDGNMLKAVVEGSE